uniref:DRBM domain-containing protein n=1 Tax=Musa acuminata subsp. malaccensis TaxID=214687 RepID=A0A804KQ98_MUSAM
MDDVVQALIEHLVEPLLPARVSSAEPPTIDQQNSVAKQMHSVVLLYNYYHRKQFPRLEFLCFEAFCKVATIAKPILLTYMNVMHKNAEELQDLDQQLSVMEKKIMDACNISKTLDALKNAPNMDGWLVSRVAVFLVDASKEKCFLDFGSMTQGVWSLVEKEIKKPIALVNSRKMKKHASKNKSFSCDYSDGLLENEDSLQQLAFSVMEQKTGISCSKFSILERHLTYSLTQEKTTIRLYVMISMEVVTDGLVEFSIKDVLTSLSGPLIVTGLIPEVTSAVEYYHLLPYVNILSNWLSRYVTIYLIECHLKPREAPHAEFLDLPRHLPEVSECSLRSDRVLTVESHEMNNLSGQVEQIVDTSSNNISKAANEVTNKKCSSLHPTNGPSNGCTEKADMLNSVKKPHITKSNEGQTFGQVEQIVATSNNNIGKTANELTSKKSSSLHPRNDPSNGCTEQADMLNSSKKPRITKSNDGETFGRKSRNDLLQASLRILIKRRNDLVQQQRCLEDEIAHCEMNIQAIVNGQGSMKSKVESMIEACNALCSDVRGYPQEIKVKRLSEAILRSKSSSQELDDMCCENGWILPRYTVLPSTADGYFQASVTVRGIDFEMTANGDSMSSPCDARLAAATNMLSKIRSMIEQQRA